MDHPKLTILKTIGKKLAVLALIVASTVGAFATLGDGKTKSSDAPRKSLLSNRTNTSTGIFSLKSGYSYRGSQVINTESERSYVRLNTIVTMQKGNTTYTVPLKKKVILDRVKIDISNRQLKRN
jgi:hypothetical protein